MRIEISGPFVIKLPNINVHGDPFSCSSLFSFVQGHFHMPCAGMQVCIKVVIQTADIDRTKYDMLSQMAHNYFLENNVR
jgi:hypothetical protein